MADEQTKEAKVKITPRGEDFPRWYTDVIAAADLADYSPVKGCMVIKPYGYALWETIQAVLGARIKETGAENAYFPLFIPEEFLRREAEHVEGFSPELAVVTYAGGKELDEKLVVRPTSETIMYDSFSRWIRSYRDLPMMINQWCNVVRWEMRTRLFLRTTEFLWQEGHTAHATHEEAEGKVLEMLEIYREFLQDTMAIPVITGAKSAKEKFAGALQTHTIEALMQDGKALQCGTSHDLGQNFAKAFDITFLDDEGELRHTWQTSWGMTTRLIGALVMVHGDDKGIVIPPQMAHVKVVFVPIWKSDEEKAAVCEAARGLAGEMDVEAKIDDRDLRPAWRYTEWERKGVPVRIEIGPRDLANDQAVVVRRDTGEKTSVAQSELAAKVTETLESIQRAMLDRALAFREANTRDVDSWDEVVALMEGDGGFARVGWCGDEACEDRVQEETKATIRCILGEEPGSSRLCVVCGKDSTHIVMLARAY